MLIYILGIIFITRQSIIGSDGIDSSFNGLTALWLLSDLERWKLTARNKVGPDKQTNGWRLWLLGLLSEPKRCLTHNLSLFSLIQESKKCWYFRFPLGNTPDSYRNSFRNYQELMIMHKLSFITVYYTVIQLRCIFYDEGSQLWDFITQAFLAKNKKFLCSLDWIVPDFSKLTQLLYVANF